MNWDDNRAARKYRRLKADARALIRITTIILLGGIAARIVFIMLDTLAAREFGNFGGEILLPVYIVLMPLIGWKLRGRWTNEAKPTMRKGDGRMPQKRSEPLRCHGIGPLKKNHI
jgi:hypothetical protein